MKQQLRAVSFTSQVAQSAGNCAESLANGVNSQVNDWLERFLPEQKVTVQNSNTAVFPVATGKLAMTTTVFFTVEHE